MIRLTLLIDPPTFILQIYRSTWLMPSPTPVPPDITCRIAYFLLDDIDGVLRDVANLRLLSTGTYETVTPVLFSTFIVDGYTTALDVSELEDGISSRSGSESCDPGTTGVGRESFVIGNAAHRRRLNNLRYVRHLVIRSSPPLDLMLRHTCQPRLIFPQVSSITLSTSVTDSLRTFSPDNYDHKSSSTPLPPILHWLLATCRPARLSLRFPIVPSSEWAEYRDESTPGSYQLIARLTALVEPGSPWKGALHELEVKDIVHQVPPSLRGLHNIYHFANHLTSPPSRSIPPGPRCTGLAGPEWNYRAWQISISIKSLFPSGTPAVDVLDSTRWTFINLPGHVLTKDDRDDQDDLGVEWNEVDTLVRDLVENGLRADLPAREGFGEEELDRLFERVKYVDTAVNGGDRAR